MFSLPVNGPKPLKSIPRLPIVKSILGSSGPVCGVNGFRLQDQHHLLYQIDSSLAMVNHLNQFGKH